MAATLTVPYLGTPEQRARQERSDDTFTINLKLVEASFERNNFQQADSASVVVDWAGTGLDPRVLDDGVLTLYMGDAADDFWVPSDDELVFIGHVKNVEKELVTDEATRLSIEAVDYTDLFLNAKPFGSSGIPRYSDTLLQAWQRICGQVPGSDVLADRLVALGDARTNMLLGRAVAERFVKLAQVPTNPTTEAWAVWLQCVGMLGLISWIDKDDVIVTTSTDLYTERNSPVFTWGENLATLRECRKVPEFKAGVVLVAFDPLAGKAIEVFYPEINDPPVVNKQVRPRPARKTKKPKAAKAPAISDEYAKRHFFTYHGVTDPELLRTIAERVWNQISRQEFQGRLSTPHMQVKRVDGSAFNVLQLRAGDSIRVRIDERTFIADLPDTSDRIRALMRLGHDKDTATLLAYNAGALSELGDTFYVDSVRATMSEDAEGGNFEVEVSFVNKISVTEGAVK